MDIRSAIRRLVDVPSIDPDEARRRKLLNILLSGALVGAVMELVLTGVASRLGLFSPGNITVLYVSGVGAVIGLVGTYCLNRYARGAWARAVFLLLFLCVALFVDEPEEVVQGRTLIAFSLPILAASVLVRPWASFLMAATSALAINVRALFANTVADPFAMVFFFAIAVVAWLAASAMESAIRDLRTLNLELDARVQDRTRELAESLAKNEAILDGIADGVIVFDNQDKAIVANPALTDLLGHPAEEIAGRDIETLMGDDVDAKDQETVVNLLRDRATSHSGIKLQWGKKTVSMSMAPVRDHSDRVTGTVAVFRDFTREAEIDRMKSTFVSIASHELRTPLNAIMGYTEMLQENIYGPLTDRQRGAMERLMSNTGHMLNLVNNLLDRARMEAGTLQLNITSFSASGLIAGMKGVMEVMAQVNGLKLSTRIADDVPVRLFGDRQRLHQILINLINNAIKFTEQGSVDVRIYMPDPTHWALEVSDTGVGIPEEALSYIFDPFRQADESATREYGGAGLGLSIVKQLINLMEGEIRLESEVDRGSTFTVVLPLILSEPVPLNVAE